MTDEEILEQIKDAITEQLEVEREKIKPESTFFEDLEADSLDVVELILTFEEAFKIDISDEDAAEIKSVNDVLDFVKKTA
uniref:acyl carrier protein n=1 Tax=Meringosphaera mediterranea TaxID=2837474 RepID=UPI00286BE1F2|nr:acyl carrier protein [Meringosphaera mediterranea]WLD05683.1 acyl carrier protein [Meringosphaera mediterranea]WLD05799.1 acyl carrier protein [Meringosphaera mediterranea]WLD06019.1 acyl carrier protein [Meringosphaera mediterranea]